MVQAGIQKVFTRQFFVLAVLLSAPAAYASVLFEGYSKISSGGVHIGFSVSRYEFDGKTKKFTGTHFITTNTLGGSITESYTTISDEDFGMQKYQYTLITPEETKTIDGEVKKGNWTATVKTLDLKKVAAQGAGKNAAAPKEVVVRISKKLPKGAFFSSNLVYVMMKSPKGISTKQKYDYTALAEEDGDFHKGVAVVENKEKMAGLNAFRVINQYKDAKFISFVTEKGQVLGTRAPIQSIGTELVPQPSLATNNINIPHSTLKILFGDVPIGVDNSISQEFQKNPKLLVEAAANKDEEPIINKGHAPVGKGIMQKKSGGGDQ